MAKALAKSAYQKLLKDIGAAHDAAMSRAALAIEHILKRAYWDIGRMIVEVEQNLNNREKSSDALLLPALRNISKRLVYIEKKLAQSKGSK